MEIVTRGMACVALLPLLGCITSGAVGTHVLLRRGEGSRELENVAHRSAQGGLVVIPASADPRGAPAGWDLLAVIDGETLGKLVAPAAFLTQAETSGGPDPLLEIELTLDGDTMPGNEGEVLAKLRAAGVETSMLQGTVLRGTIRPSGLGRTLALAWVLRLDLLAPSP